MFLVVGLGNPGGRYAGTRHNVGFSVAERLADRWQITCTNSHHGALVGSGQISGERIVLALPQKFMNLSGQPVASLVSFYKLDADHVVVVHDDVDLPFGAVRVKTGGGHGGHNGLRDISHHISTDYLRVRCGVGRPADGRDTADHVLGRWSDDEIEAVPDMVQRAADAVQAVLSDGVLAAMNRFNVRAARGRTPTSDTPDEPVELDAASARREEQ